MISNITPEKCLLCGKKYKRLARSHVIPWGFMKQSECSHDMVLMGEGEFPRRRDKGIYDNHILCDDCEHRYFHSADDYAIRIYRDLQGAEEISFVAADGEHRCQRFASVDRRLLRMFFASVLWRCSVAKCSGLSEFSIGEKYERRIAKDILSNGTFDYIDAVGIRYDVSKQNELIKRMSKGFVLPIKSRLEYENRIANGFNFYIPDYKFGISLDQRPNPFAFQWEDSVELPDGISSSLASRYDGVGLMIFQGGFPKELFTKMVRVSKTTKCRKG